MNDIALIYSPFPDEEIAQSIAHILVAEKMVACANILPSCKSVYEWEDSIHNVNEVPVLFKTVRAQVRNVIERIAQLHPYETPSIVSWNVADAPESFQQWVKRQTCS